MNRKSSSDSFVKLRDSAPVPQLVCSFEGGKKWLDNGIEVVCLYGRWEQMGRQWGALTSGNIGKILDFIETKTSGGKEDFIRKADALYSHYPTHLREFLEAAARTSGFSLRQLKNANCVEWGEPTFNCSGIACWGDYASEGLVYGRNYDAVSYAPIGETLTITVFHPSDGPQAFATLGYAGELYCINGFNESGLFVELNNGMPSTGFDINFDISLNTTELMRLIANARTLEDADEFFKTTESAAGFLIGVANTESARCYEWFADRAHRSDIITPDGLMVLTNHFVSREWKFADPAEDSCWKSHARRNNLLEFAEKNKGKIDADALRALMPTRIEEGGPSIEGLSMYHLVIIPERKTLYLDIPGIVNWAEINLGNYF